MSTQTSTIIALDIGEKRVGVARASLAARMASPLMTLENNAHIWEELEQVCQNEEVIEVVVGLPRGLDGQATGQTRYAEAFAREAEKRLKLPVQFQDEAVTSKQAERELIARGSDFQKSDIDALAATYILEDYLRGR